MKKKKTQIKMKQVLLLCFALLTGVSAWSQTGVGVVLLTDEAYTFPETTVDSTSTVTFQLVNQLATTQTVYFGTMEAPFSLDDNTPQVLESQDTVEVTMLFNPTAVGTYSTELEVVGGIFGSATLSVSGTGIQVALDWVQAGLAFDTTALGQTSTQSLTLYNIGQGTALVEDVQFSNAAFTTVAGTSTLSIPEGGSASLEVAFAPVNAGSYSETLTISTNDPNNPTLTFSLDAVAISEVSGEICDQTWTPANSPYTLVGDVVVPAGCTLTLEAGTEVIGNDHDIEVFGSFFADGEDGNEVTISCGELISHTAAEQMVLTHSTVTETNEFSFPDVDYRSLQDTSLNDSNLPLPQALDSLAEVYAGGFNFQNTCQCDYHLFENENSESHFGKYSEDFSDDEGQGWTPSGSVDSQGGSGNYQVYYNGSTSYYYNTYIESPQFLLNPGEWVQQLSFRSRMDYWSTNYSRSMTYEVSYNNGSWETLGTSDSPNDNAWIESNFELYPPSNVQTVQFRIRFYYRYYSYCYVDDFELTTNFYPGIDVPFTTAAAAAAAASLSTGGINLHNVAFMGDFHSVNDSLSVVIENSSIGKNAARERESHGLGLYANHVEMQTTQSAFANHDLDGVHIESDFTGWTSMEVSISGNGADGVSVNGDLDWTSTEDIVQGNGEDGIDAGANSNITMFGPEIWENEGRGLAAGEGSAVDLDYARIDGNGSHGVDLESGGSLDLANSRLLNNGGQGIQSGSPTTLNHCNLAFNGGTGLVLTGNNFHTLNNSILWGNNETNYTQIDIGGGVISTSYSTVQGQSGYGVTGSGQFYWGEGVIEADPLFADDDLHLNIYSPCVDGGQPWLMDAHMPYGLGGVRADMGMYGGPDNAYWGGLALPDGASTLQAVEDAPQDQGNTVGLTFSSSFYDNSELVNNVTHYAFWRHFDPTGEAISSLEEGNWELLGTMPSLSLDNYAYQAPTLGNTNAFGDFSSCYFVAAHTADDDTYWISNVVCGESVDNLAPEEPELNGLVLETGAAQVFWPEPAESDYAYTEIFSDAGFAATISADTLVTDAAAPAGAITYTAVHYDVNGNASDVATVTLDVGLGEDVIPLQAGWNLISLDRSPVAPQVEEVFDDLQSGNLQYVTSFSGGVEFYDPNGLSFLNSLSNVEDYRGYWVKVAEADTLHVAGSALNGTVVPQLQSGWNLIGYAGAEDVMPAAHFADEIAADNLLYVTGFDAGFSYFDPNGLPFLNSLNALRNGFGYWVKVLEGAEAGNGLTVANAFRNQQVASPAFMVVNGVSDLVDAEGGVVQVVNALGQTVAELPILADGYLMSTAIFGDDPVTATAEGCQPGEPLHFEWNGRRAEQVVTFEDQMTFKQLALTFNTTGFEVYPNPFSTVLTITGTNVQPATVSIQLTDAQGRQVADLVSAGQVAGPWNFDLTGIEMSPGIYNCTIQVEGQPAFHQKVIRQ